MVEIGKRNTLRVVKFVDFGVYLDGENFREILLPSRYVPQGCAVGDEIDIFLYLDSDDLLIATTETPKAMVGECAYLKVVAVNQVGAFLDWGLPKELLVPFGEQQKPLEVGKSYVVYLYIDNASQRIAASTQIDKFLPAHYSSREMPSNKKDRNTIDKKAFLKTNLNGSTKHNSRTILCIINPFSIYQKKKNVTQT